MSKKHNVSANSFRVADSPVFDTGNFSFKYMKNKSGKKETDNAGNKVASDIDNNTVHPVTITGGFHNATSSEFNDKNQLGISLNNSDRRKSLLSSSLSTSLTHSKTQKPIINSNQMQMNWRENSASDKSYATQLRTQEQQKIEEPSQHADVVEPAGTDYSSMKLPGGFINREIEAWVDDSKKESYAHTGLQPLRRISSSGSIKQISNRSRRSTFNSSVIGPSDLETGLNLNIRDLNAPGAFRRNFLLNRLLNKYSDESNLVTRNVAEFLELYGKFAGQDLREDSESRGNSKSGEVGVTDDEDEEEGEQEEEDVEQGRETSCDEHHGMETDTDELRSNYIDDYFQTGGNRIRTPNKRLVKVKTKNKKWKKTSTPKAFLLLLKAFLGTGIIFLPRAFSAGGLLFSNFIIILFSLISYYCFVILIKTTSKCKVSGYGDVGYKIFGKQMQFIILISLVLSQLGFASTYVVFVSENFQQVAHIWFNKSYSIKLFILLQVIIFTPISLTRSLSKLGASALVADAFIFLGLIYIYCQSSAKLVTDGFSDKVELFKSNTWTLLIGTAVFTYEGIGLLIPIQESMQEPEKFNKLLLYVMVIVTFVFTTIASISYLSFGDDIHTIILMDFPMNNMTISVQFMYCTAILLSTPIQLFPAIKIVENYLFNQKRKTWKNKIRRNSEAISILSGNTANAIRANEMPFYDSVNNSNINNPNYNLVNTEGIISGKSDSLIKTLKNIIRVFMAMFMCGIAYLGSNKLDKFVSLIGSLTCVPLIYIYPPLLYYRKFSNEIKSGQKLICLFVFITGCILMIYTSFVTIKNW